MSRSRIRRKKPHPESSFYYKHKPLVLSRGTAPKNPLEERKIPPPAAREARTARKRNYRRTCKPGSVRSGLRSCHLSVTVVASRLSAASAVLPGRHDPGMGSPRGGVASDRVYICTQLPVVPVSFYLAFPSVPCGPPERTRFGSLFLLHFPGGFPRRTLSVILPFDARTFLMPIPCGAMTRGSPVCSASIPYPARKVKRPPPPKSKIALAFPRRLCYNEKKNPPSEPAPGGRKPTPDIPPPSFDTFPILKRQTVQSE